jgi:uncharacterized protein with PQ loop repeat
MKFYNNPLVVNKTPLITVVLLESANLFQLIRMWSEQSVVGQSLQGWICVNIALILWLNYYRVILPKEKIAFYSTLFGILMNSLVILTVVFFRYFN